jgi:signal transduction histidine kinase
VSAELGPLVKFLDLAALPHYSSGDEEQLRRARLLVAVSLFMGVSILGFAVLNLLSGRPVPPTSIAISAVAGLAFVAIPFLLRTTGALRALSWALTFGTLIAIVAAAWNAYGLYSPGLLTLPIPVLIGLVLGGRRLGGTVATLGLAAVIGFYLLDRQADRFTKPPLDAANAFLLVSVLGLGIVLVTGIGWFYESLRRHAFAQASEALEVAEAANAAKREFLASMSHELRTPLNSVIGFSQVVRKKEELSSSGDDMLERVHSSGLHLLRLVDQILDVSKVEAGEVEMHLEALDVGELVRLTLRDLEGQKPREHVELIAELPLECSPSITDREMLRQIVVNLVVNAFKFTREGSVTVRVLCDPTGMPEVLEVEDTGIGIPQKKLDEIFERFVQVDTGTSRQFEGTGLGLSICKDLCDLMDYKLSVESTQGQGTTFRVNFS